MTSAPHLILASASPRRGDLLREAGLKFEVIPADVEELLDPTLPLPELTEENASRKATAVAAGHPDALVIGADTLVTIDGRALGKPEDLEEAVRMLELLAGRTHEVCTGVCLCGVRPGEPDSCVRFHEITRVTFRALTRPQIEDYLRRIDPLDKAGAYAAQQEGSLIIESTAGSWTNVVGLPMERLQTELSLVLDTSPLGGTSRRASRGCADPD